MEQSTVKKVLVVVDMQNDFVSGALGSAEAQAIVEPVVKRILDFDGLILYTLDTHTQDYLNTKEGQKLPVEHCIAGTEGWAPNPAVWMALMHKNVADEQHMIAKDTFGGVSLPMRIHEMLAGIEPEEIELVGLCTDICVISNALLLKAFYPESTITVDAAACAGATPEGHKTALAAMKACHIDIVNE
ncbi:MAG: isochorismatase family cysteine hydrolase [Eubacteriales bacterium]|jgi:nicotinamidase-related amidase|nr:isochorismatase family cysteine hydrolase [Eubacteriales bacterium]